MILLISFLLIGSIVMTFFRMRISAPEIEDQGNPHTNYLEQRINLLPLIETRDSLESSYVSIKDEIEVFSAEQLLENAASRQSMTHFMGAYVGRFSQLCEDLFSHETWPSYNRKFIETKAADLLALSAPDGSPALDPEQRRQIERYAKIMEDYKAATTLQQKYNGSIESSASAIRAAHAYLNDEYLRNCSAVRKHCEGLAGRLNESHYTFLKNEVNALRDSYTHISRSIFEERAAEVQRHLNDYYSNAGSVYGSIYGEDLRENYTNVVNRAEYYYD